MGADKKSSWRMNSTYTPNPQPRIPTRVCQGHLVTTDLPTLGSNPNSKQHGSTTQESNNLGNLQRSGQTVGVVRADGPHGVGRQSAGRVRTVRKMTTNFQYCTSEIRTVRELTVDSLLLADGPASPGGRSGQQPPSKTYRPNGSKQNGSRTHEELDEHLAGQHLAGSPPTPRGRSARHGNSSPSPTSQRSTPSLCLISRINQGIATKS
jgi:hypothetical protein